MIQYRYLLLFLLSFFLVGCFTTKSWQDYDLTGKKVVTDLDALPVGKVGEPYFVDIKIYTPASLRGVFGTFLDRNNELQYSNRLEKVDNIEATNEERINENLSRTEIFTNPQGLEFQLKQRVICRRCDYKGYFNQLIISGIPKKAGVYDFYFWAMFTHLYGAKAHYKLEVLP